MAVATDSAEQLPVLIWSAGVFGLDEIDRTAALVLAQGAWLRMDLGPSGARLPMARSGDRSGDAGVISRRWSAPARRSISESSGLFQPSMNICFRQ